MLLTAQSNSSIQPAHDPRREMGIESKLPRVMMILLLIVSSERGSEYVSNPRMFMREAEAHDLRDGLPSEVHRGNDADREGHAHEKAHIASSSWFGDQCCWTVTEVYVVPPHCSEMGVIRGLLPSTFSCVLGRLRDRECTSSRSIVPFCS